MMPAFMETNADALVVFFLCFLLAGWIYRSWRALSELKHAPTLKLHGLNSRSGSISVLIPAKNEAKNIADCVKPLLSQLRENDEVIVINNCSTDETEEILNEMGAQEIPTEGSAPVALAKSKLKYLNTPSTPDGWTGKNFALHLGVRHATGNWFLFTDADTRHEPGSMDASVGFAEKNSLDLLTLLPRCLAHGFWENLIQPCAMAYMGLWFPLRKINDPRSKIFFANGQYLLIRKDHYSKTGGHLAVKEAFLEDFALMKKTKEMGARGLCGFGMEIYGTRMYDSFATLWRGWRRIFLHAFRQKPGPLFRCIASVVCFSVFPPVIFVISLGQLSVAFLLSALVLAMALGTAFKAYSIVDAQQRYALLHPLAAFVFALILSDAFRMAVFKHRTHWR